MNIHRIIVNTAIMQEVTGLSLKTCQRDLRIMKENLGKAKHQYVTLKEYADYVGIPLEDILAVLVSDRPMINRP